MGFHVPGVDKEATLVNGDALRLLTSTRKLGKEDDVSELILGSLSSYNVTYESRIPKEARNTFNWAVRVWAEMFSCKPRLRIQVKWRYVDRDYAFLAAANVPFSDYSLYGNGLQRCVAYMPAVAMAKSGVDRTPGFFTPRSCSTLHIHGVMVFLAKYVTTVMTSTLLRRTKWVIHFSLTVLLASHSTHRATMPSIQTDSTISCK